MAYSGREVLSELGATVTTWGKVYSATYRRNALTAVEYLHNMLRDIEEKSEEKDNVYIDKTNAHEKDDEKDIGARKEKNIINDQTDINIVDGLKGEQEVAIIYFASDFL